MIQTNTADLCLVNSFDYSHGQPPTPTRTPTSATFSPRVFRTPKVESSFYDPRVTWNTADPCAESPSSLKTPTGNIPTTPSFKQPSENPSHNSPLSGKDLEAKIASHVHHRSPNPNLTLPPVEPSRQLSSSPNPNSEKRSVSRGDLPLKSPRSGLHLDTQSTMKSASNMQTPPPTSTSASRRKAQQAQVAKLVQQSASRRSSVPGNPNSRHATGFDIDTSPQDFSSLQLSPDVLNFPNSGPATAPIYSQHKLFWEPEQANRVNIDFSGNLEDPFTVGRQQALDPYVSTYVSTLISQSPSTSFVAFPSEFNTTKLSNTRTSSLDAIRFNAKADPLQSTRPNPLGHGVDPSLLFSSPGQYVESSHKVAAALDEDVLQPYAYQIQEAKREQAMNISRRSDAMEEIEAESPAVKSALQSLREDESQRAALKRSMTDSVVNRVHKRQSSKNIDDPTNPSNITRRASPLKQTRGHLTRRLNLPRPQHRTAITLKIDSSGKARTEAKVIVADTPEGATFDMDLDLPSMNGLSDESSTDVDDETVSHGLSLRIPSQRVQKPKMDRCVTNPNAHSQRSSYSSIRTSASQTNNRRKYVGTSERTTDERLVLEVTDLNPSFDFESYRADDDTFHRRDDCVAGADSRIGKAQYEIKKMLENRIRGRSNGLHAGIGNSKDTTSNEFDNISPTTITDPDHVTPNSDRDSQSSGSIRCVCWVADAEGQMIGW